MSSSRYSQINNDTSGSPPTTPSRRSSFVSLRRPSFSRRPTATQIPDPDEMDAAFDKDDEDDEEDGQHENRGLLGSERDRQGREWKDGGAEIEGVFNDPLRDTQADQGDEKTQDRQGMPGSYDFDRDYFLPPSSSPPPFQTHSRQHPAPGNTNGIISSSTAVPAFRNSNRGFLGGILPSAFQRNRPNTASGAVGGGATSGVFANLAARPEGNIRVPEGGTEGPEWVPEETQKEGPPSYNAALRDAVPPYWETTVVLPSSSSPFGPLSSSMSGDEILIDGMPVGNLFSFAWNLVVSVSFQFVGFLLTYVLHTTHAAKHGSRVGLGLTLIQFGLTIRSRAEELIKTGHFSDEDDDPFSASYPNPSANNTHGWWDNAPWPQTFHPSANPEDPPVTLHNPQEAAAWAALHNETLADLFGMPSAAEVGRANEWFSFLLMSIGWFLVLTGVGGYWRVKRFERGLRHAQESTEGETEETTTSTAPRPTQLAYYTSAFSGALNGANEIRRGFFGHRGRRTDEHELLDAQAFELNEEGPPGATARESNRRAGGLW